MYKVIDYKDNKLGILDTDDEKIEYFDPKGIKAVLKAYPDLTVYGITLAEDVNPIYTLDGLEVNLWYPINTRVGRWCVCLLKPGDYYGRSLSSKVEKPTVHFYDTGSENFPKAEYPVGQFVSSYYASTLLSHGSKEEDHSTEGLLSKLQEFIAIKDGVEYMSNYKMEGFVYNKSEINLTIEYSSVSWTARTAVRHKLRIRIYIDYEGRDVSVICDNGGSSLTLESATKDTSKIRDWLSLKYFCGTFLFGDSWTPKNLISEKELSNVGDLIRKWNVVTDNGSSFGGNATESYVKDSKIYFELKRSSEYYGATVTAEVTYMGKEFNIRYFDKKTGEDVPSEYFYNSLDTNWSVSVVRDEKSLIKELTKALFSCSKIVITPNIPNPSDGVGCIGLKLDASVPAWTVSGKEMKEIKIWLRHQLEVLSNDRGI